jgi:hypothetical protein
MQRTVKTCDAGVKALRGSDLRIRASCSREIAGDDRRPNVNGRDGLSVVMTRAVSPIAIASDFFPVFRNERFIIRA